MDVIHSPHYTMPMTAGMPVVVTLHDATFFTDRRLHLGMKGRFFRAGPARARRPRSAWCPQGHRPRADPALMVDPTGSSSPTTGWTPTVPPPTPAEVGAAAEFLGLADRR